MRITPIIAGLVLVLCTSFNVLAQDSELLEQAQQLLDQGDAEAAYSLLEPAFETSTGTPEYDLLFGIAALESGRPTEAVFAFERVLAVDPDNDRARAELARAYFEMGENQAAREEFTAIDRGQVPESVAQSIGSYLTEIDAALAATQRRFSLFVEMLGGYDSNVNSATDISEIAIPAFGDLAFTLDESGVAQDSGFISAAGGGSFSAVVNSTETLRAFGSAEVRRRQPYNELPFRTLLGNAQLGLRYAWDNSNTIMGSVFGQTYDIGGESNRDLAGIDLQWLHSYSNRTQISAFTRLAAHRYPNQEVRDLNQISGGIGLVHLLDAAGDPVLFGSVYGGSDEQLRNDREDFGRTFVGLRLGAEYSWNPRTNLVGNISYQYNRYGDADPLFQERRKDHFLFLRAGVEYALTERWLIRPEIQYVYNESSLPINDFDRWQPFVTVRYQF